MDMQAGLVLICGLGGSVVTDPWCCAEQVGTPIYRLLALIHGGHRLCSSQITTS